MCMSVFDASPSVNFCAGDFSGPNAGQSNRANVKKVEGARTRTRATKGRTTPKVCGTCMWHVNVASR